MTRQREREEFIAVMVKEGVPLAVTRKVLRYSATLQRLAEAQCNGDYPADNGERKVVPCSRCEAQWTRGSMVQDHTAPTRPMPCGDGETRRPNEAYERGSYYVPLICKDCRTADLVTAAVAPYGITPIFQGDPRGAVVKLRVPSGYTNDMGREGVCVP
jgi:hypothetical protein